LDNIIERYCLLEFYIENIELEVSQTVTEKYK